jgi:predicted nucleic acid-binding protein
VKRVFVDTGAFFALRVPEDRFHEHARVLYQRANVEHWRLITTNAVLIETYSLLLSRARGGRRTAIEFLDMIASDDYRVERTRITDEQRAVALLRAHDDKTYSLCDALSFVVMERLRIKEAIAFDRHFREYGRFTIL